MASTSNVNIVLVHVVPLSGLTPLPPENDGENAGFAFAVNVKSTLEALATWLTAALPVPDIEGAPARWKVMAACEVTVAAKPKNKMKYFCKVYLPMSKSPQEWVS